MAPSPNFGEPDPIKIIMKYYGGGQKQQHEIQRSELQENTYTITDWEITKRLI